MTGKKKKEDPISLKVNFEINAKSMKEFWKKIKNTVFIVTGSGVVAHGTFQSDFYINILKKLTALLEAIFR